MTICKECKYKIKCALLSTYNPIPLLIECKLHKDCNLINSSKNYIKVKDGSRMLKKILKHKYPKYKWSVKSSIYGGGSSIRANYIDPDYNNDNFQSYSEKSSVIKEDNEISDLCDEFSRGHFNGMIDSYEYNENVLGCVSYVFSNRRMIDYGVLTIHEENRVNKESGEREVILNGNDNNCS